MSITLAATSNFDTQTSHLYGSEFNLTSRKFVFEIELETSQPFVMTHEDSYNSSFSAASMQASNFSVECNFADYAIFTTDANSTNGTGFFYSAVPLNSSASSNGTNTTTSVLLQFTFFGNFTYASYDPDFTVLVAGMARTLMSYHVIS